MTYIRNDDELTIEDQFIRRQRWLRVTLTVAAYAYEFESKSIITDAEFDKRCYEVDLNISTIEFWHHRNYELCKRYQKLDAFWRTEFEPSTGMWIRKHPELEITKRAFLRLYG